MEKKGAIKEEIETDEILKKKIYVWPYILSRLEISVEP